MIKTIKALLFWTLILCACSTNLPSTDTGPLAPAIPPAAVTEITPELPLDSPALPIPKFAKTLQTPHIDQPPNGNEASTPQTYGGCGYQWASKDLTDLSAQLDVAIKTIDANAKGRASAFGEDCVHANGDTTFGAMETDFYIQQAVTNLSDLETFGNWIVQAMQIIEALPDDLIAGPGPGFVEFSFIKNDSEHVIVRVPIQKYQTEATGKSGEELFRLFYTNP